MRPRAHFLLLNTFRHLINTFFAFFSTNYGQKKTAHRFDVPWLVSKRQNYKKSMSILKSFKKSIIWVVSESSSSKTLKVTTILSKNVNISIAGKLIVKIFYYFLCTSINIYQNEKKFMMKKKLKNFHWNAAKQKFVAWSIQKLWIKERERYGSRGCVKTLFLAVSKIDIFTSYHCNFQSFWATTFWHHSNDRFFEAL